MKMTAPIVPSPQAGPPPGFESRRRIGAISAVASTPEKAVQDLCAFVDLPLQSGAHVHLVNAYTVSIADRDDTYRRVLSENSINLPDGKPLSWVSKLRGDVDPLTQIRGPQFFLDVIDHGRERNLRHYLLGSTEAVLRILKAELLLRYPGAQIVGMQSPPFRELDHSDLAAQDALIRSSGAQIVWVGLGTPKQDHEAKRLADALPVTAIAIGAAFDFAAGTAKEAPPILRRLGLEWLYRLATEPRRLWRRYVFGNARFISSAIRFGRGSL
jgi:N-acetylglucosaminyldiphosphoundecaprenol N-acetyl-beta-D-mannosaminyltransferase